MLKLNKLFHLETEANTFYGQIQPSDAQRAFLVECKNAIRDHLRQQIREASTRALGMDKTVEPRFRTQGSWSYKTCIQPAHQPPQEMDWDFGVYLPVTVWEDHSPRVAAKTYFNLVEQSLSVLCRKNGWTLNSDKDTCIRVEVAPWAHIDVPLYAAPEEKFVQILEKSARSFAAARNEAHDSMYLAESEDQGELTTDYWEDIDEIVLATRKGTWKESDPHAVSRWFNDRVAEHGEQLRRVCRYLKAWRDYRWPEGDSPSSIALMICAVQGFVARRGRDDLALEDAAGRLASSLRGEIRERAIDDGAEDFNNLPQEKRNAAGAAAADLHKCLCGARSYMPVMKQQAVADLQRHLGPRIPSRVELIELDTGADEIRSTPAQQVRRPVVAATKAG